MSRRTNDELEERGRVFNVRVRGCAVHQSPGEMQQTADNAFALFEEVLCMDPQRFGALLAYADKHDMCLHVAVVELMLKGLENEEKERNEP